MKQRQSFVNFNCFPRSGFLAPKTIRYRSETYRSHGDEGVPEAGWNGCEFSVRLSGLGEINPAAEQDQRDGHEEYEQAELLHQ